MWRCDELTKDVWTASVETELLSLKRSAPPRNVLLVQKAHAPAATAALVEFVRHLQSRYEPAPAVIVEEEVARALRGQVRQPLYSLGPGLAAKVDLIATFGGDGTILRAASLFAAERTVPPILSFSMGTLGFLSEWKFAEYGDAFRQAYHPGTPYTPRGGSAECKGDQCKVILRSRLNVGIFDRSGRRVSLNRDCEGDSDKGEHDNIGEEKAGENVSESGGAADFFAMNEVIVHRGREPHIATIDVFVGTRFLTSAIADGVIVSTPTGSTAYSLSSGGSIVHPLVPALLLTPICPRSLSFRPLVLPATVPITLRLSEHNRARQVEVSIDGVNRRQPLQKGMEIRVVSEQLKDAGPGARWSGGVPLIVRNAAADTPNDSTGDGHWVGGLNGLLKFNHPFGEEARES